MKPTLLSNSRLNAALRRFPSILFALTALLSISVVCYFIIGPAEGYFHADCTDTIFWAQASYDSGKVFHPDFNYAALLPFSASIWFIPLIAIFGVTMKTHVIGMIVFLCLFVLSIVVVCRKMKWSYAYTFGTVTLMLLVMSSSDKLREIMWNHVIYYSLGLLLYFFALALVFLTWERVEAIDKTRKSLTVALLLLLLTLVFSALNATNGFQMLVLTILPVCAGIFFERLADRNVPLFSKKNLPAALVLFGIFAGMFLGSRLLNSLLGDISAGYANAYSSYSDPKNWAGNAEDFLMNVLTLLGLDAKNGMDLVSPESIANLIRIAAGIVLLVVPMIALICYRKLSSRYTRVIVIGHAFLFAFLLFGCICGRLSAANWRLTPLLGSAILVTVAAIREVHLQRERAVLSLRFGALAMVVLVLLSGLNARLISKMPFDYGRDNTLHVLAERLEKEGLTYGYATFWTSQSVTLLSDSKVKVREILVDRVNIETDMYQSQAQWYEDQDGVEEYFVVLSMSEWADVNFSDYWEEITSHCLVRTFDCQNYRVFVFAENIWHDHSGEPIVERDESFEEDEAPVDEDIDEGA